MTEGSLKGLLKPDVVEHTFNSSTGKQRQLDLLCVPDQPGLCSETPPPPLKVFKVSEWGKEDGSVGEKHLGIFMVSVSQYYHNVVSCHCVPSHLLHTHYDCAQS